MDCTGAWHARINLKPRREYLLWSCLRCKGAIQPVLLMLEHAGLLQGGMPVSFPGQFLLRQPGHVASNGTVRSTPTTALGKRPPGAEEPQGDGGVVGINVPSQKRATGRGSSHGSTFGIPNPKWSTARTRRNLVARTPEASMANPTWSGGTRDLECPGSLPPILAGT
jgi:hypothetical protein